MTKIEIKNLSILFGPEKMRAKRMLVAGKSKQNILKETGCTVAVRNANLKIEEVICDNGTFRKWKIYAVTLY